MLSLGNVVRGLVCAFVCVSCGSSSGSPADQEPEGSVDAAAVPQERDVTVSLGPELGDTIVFSSMENGLLLDTARTDVEGTAVLLGRDGGMISFVLFENFEITKLVTVFEIDTSQELRFEVPAPTEQPPTNTNVAVPSLPGANKYYVYACEDAARAASFSGGANLSVDDACFDDGPIPIIALAENQLGVIAYSDAVIETADDLASPPAVVWRTDVVQEAFEFAAPDFAETVEASVMLKFGHTLARTPRAGVYIPEPTFKRPPGETTLLWTEFRSFGPFSGIQEYSGALPTSADDWVEVVGSASVQHNITAGPRVLWLPPNTGDLVAATYRWNAVMSTGDAFGEWLFVTSTSKGEVVHPALPEELKAKIPVGETVTYGAATIHVIDYKDIDGYQEAISAGRLPWSFEPELREDFLRGGGTVAVAGTTALRE